MKIDGKKIAQEIIEKLKIQKKPEKIFAVVLVGNDKASENFLKQKERVAKELGIDFRLYKFSSDLKNDDLRKEVLKIANLKKVGGVIVQLPLPEHINKHYILNVIPREKDIDVLGERALGSFYAGRNLVLPPAVGVVEELLSIVKCQTSNVKIAIVGRGFLIGKPIAIWLMDKVKELAIFGREGDLSELKKYDLVISGVGKAGLIKMEILKEGAGVIDFGYDFGKDGKICGDLEINKLSSYPANRIKFYTPTPGGTGPILAAKIFENFYKLNSD
ncbi:MAG: Bifunctional protein FolD [Candidatus Wolfebacteria bacterium GW2011_GWC1_37_10]|uniref:Bifunctional protein FolD n=1 Tax=Candidatus Wolfebacteria bacterium GW2011_GWC1_37_10 TaxID=1619010 RepID=A0A0G0J0V8_9BACT|nr:MAG: Bifunctional protein FolD [Candidatus Wolfebacteria bacterium GW2011_GWC1_37_10]